MILETSYQEFKNRTEGLKEFLTAQLKLKSELSEELNGSDLAKKVIEFSMLVRKYYYQTSIIELYGSVESFIENVLKEYLSKLEQLYDCYDELDSTFRENHIKLTVELLNRLGKRNHINVSQEDLFSKIASCNNGAIKINYEAFYDSTSNIRWGQLCEILSRIGLNLSCPNVKANLKAKASELNLDWERGPTNSEVSPPVISQLADRRNEIAHGRPTDVLSESVLLDWCAFIEVMMMQVCKLLTCDLLNKAFVKGRISVNKLEMIDIFNNRVLCIKAPVEQSISKNDFILVSKDNGLTFEDFGKINSIQLDGNPIEDTSDHSNSQVGIGFYNLDKIKTSHVFFFLKAT